MSTEQILLAVVLLGLLGVAVACDLRRHRIPNLLVLLGMALGLAGQSYADGLTGLGNGALGLAIGFAVFLPLYALGGMAAGDVKLMAMVGAFLTPYASLSAALSCLVVGGICGLLIVLARGQLLQTLARYGLMIRARAYIAPAVDEVASQTFPYSVAILLGTLASGLWWFVVLL
ncbi:A24 family peptidase [Metapseudomonas resinovorans]|uniref:A24 family peptidase n=1 Tax=Metapseudomonas resinovorans TaxID=53412 RepID=UPI00042018C9|nr:prepilin peptidase [Pseudomonas resinovorans]